MAAVPISQGWQLGSQVAQITVSVKKENARSRTYNDRVLMMRAPFLFMLDGPKVKRVLMITQVERLEVSGPRMLVKATRSANQRDWMVTLLPDTKNTHRDMTSIAETIRQVKKEYGSDLTVTNSITTSPQLKKGPGMQSTAEILKWIKQNRHEIPKRVPPPAPQPPSAPPEGPPEPPDMSNYLAENSNVNKTDTNKKADKEVPKVTNGRFTLKITPEEEDLGFYTTEHNIPGRPVRVKEVEPDSAAGRAGIIANQYIPCYIARVDGIPISSPDQFHDMIEDKITHNQMEFEVDIVEGEPIGATPPPSDSESESSSVSEISTREVYRTPTESTVTPPRRHIAKKKKHEPFWSDFVASYDAQKRHWDVIEPRVVSLVDSNLEGNTIPVDYELETKLLHDSRLTRTLKSRPHDYSIRRGAYGGSSPRYDRYDKRSGGRGQRKELPGPNSVVDEYLTASQLRPTLAERLSSSGRSAYERGYADALRERDSRDSSYRTYGRGEIPRSHRRTVV